MGDFCVAHVLVSYVFGPIGADLLNRGLFNCPSIWRGVKKKKLHINIKYTTSFFTHFKGVDNLFVAGLFRVRTNRFSFIQKRRFSRGASRSPPYRPASSFSTENSSFFFFIFILGEVFWLKSTPRSIL